MISTTASNKHGGEERLLPSFFPHRFDPGRENVVSAFHSQVYKVDNMVDTRSLQISIAPHSHFFKEVPGSILVVVSLDFQICFSYVGIDLLE